MKTYKIAVLGGDGVGPEVTAESIKVLKAVADKFGFALDFKEAIVGAEAIFKENNPLPDTTLQLCKESDAVLFGAIGDPYFDNNPEANPRPEQGLLRLRKELELYANVRPVKIYDKIIHKSPLKRENVQGTDLVIYRELISGIYFGDKFTDVNGQYAYDVAKYEVHEIERIVRLAFRAAQKRRKKLTLVDKANVLDTSRLWRKTCQQIAPEYPDVKLDYLFVDNATMQLVLNAKQFDVIVTGNMFGDIISDEASVIGGSIGLMPSASIGEKNGMFEPIHGAYPQAKGKNKANPIASILSAAMMLDYLGEQDAAKVVKTAVEVAIENNVVTEDLNSRNPLNTDEVGTFIAEYITYKGAAHYFNFENIKIGQSTII